LDKINEERKPKQSINQENKETKEDHEKDGTNV
jgi:hypothetical protein